MDDLVLQVKQMIIDSLELEDITINDIVTDAPLFGDGLGLDSIDALELGINIHKLFGIKVDAHNSNTKEHFRSVASLAMFINNHRTI